MAKEDGVFLIVGAYASPADARADYEIVKDLHVQRVIGGFDAAVTRRMPTARSRSTRTRPPRSRAPGAAARSAPSSASSSRPR